MASRKSDELKATADKGRIVMNGLVKDIEGS